LSLSRSFFCTTPAKKPRTECCCQPVAFITAAIVVPVGERNISTTCACFELFPSSSFRPLNAAVFGDNDSWATAGFFAAALCERSFAGLAVRLLAGFDIGILYRFLTPIAATTEAPPRPSGRRGRIPERAMSPGTDHTTALLADECQSFLDNLIAGLGQMRSWNDPMALIGSRIC
jgi:hypothetical protein